MRNDLPVTGLVFNKNYTRVRFHHQLTLALGAGAVKGARAAAARARHRQVLLNGHRQLEWNLCQQYQAKQGRPGERAHRGLHRLAARSVSSYTVFLHRPT